MEDRLPRGITRENHSFKVTVRFRGHVATAIEPTLYFAEIRKGRLLEDLINECHVGVPVPIVGVSPWTLENAYDRVAELYWSIRPGGRNSMAAARNAMVYFGRLTLVENITPHMVDHWVQSMRTMKWSASTINRHLSALSRINKFAYSRGGAATIPIITRERVRRGRIRYLTAVEEAKMFNYFTTHPRRDGPAFVRFLLDTGMRVGEMLAMREDDVDFERGVIHVWRNKTNKPRIVPMTSKVRQILKMKSTGRAENRFFPHAYKYYRRTWKQIQHALGLANDPEFVVHCLRHTCASRLIHHGVHVLTVKEWLGHKAIASTLQYVHLAPKNLYDAAAVLETGRAPGPRVTTWDGDMGGWRGPRAAT
ncbi:MAG: tyrosine-type recombinase/integrase [Alphaproteobacteria bacterium]